jgi:hypothetical protein
LLLATKVIKVHLAAKVIIKYKLVLFDKNLEELSLGCLLALFLSYKLNIFQLDQSLLTFIMCYTNATFINLLLLIL